MSMLILNSGSSTLKFQPDYYGDAELDLATSETVPDADSMGLRYFGHL
jgi:hypothetical protein